MNKRLSASQDEKFECKENAQEINKLELVKDLVFYWLEFISFVYTQYLAMTVIIHTNYIFEKSISIIITILVSLIFIEAGMVAFIFACIVFHFPSKPKHPPSITSTMERTAFLPSLYNICTNRQVYIIFSLISTICIKIFFL